MDDPSPLYFFSALLVCYIFYIIARHSALIYLTGKITPVAENKSVTTLRPVSERTLVTLFVIEVLVLLLLAFELDRILVQLIPSQFYLPLFSFVGVVLISPFVRGFGRLILPEKMAYIFGAFLTPLFKVVNLLLFPLVSIYFALLKLWGKIVNTRWNPIAVTSDSSILDLTSSSEEAELEDDEKEMIRGIYNIRDILVREIMVPRVDIIAAEDDQKTSELIDIAVENGFSRIPIYNDQIDNVVGILHAKDLFIIQGEGKKLEDVLRPPYFVPDTKNISDLLDEFLQEKTQLAVVVDEYGGTAGIITLEDVLEEIVGEIHDEYDEEEIPWVETAESVYTVAAKTDITELNQALNLEIPDEESETLGGLIVSIAGKVPDEGDKFEINGITFEVLEADERRISSILLTITSPQNVTD